jgi:hypothetical protein
MLLMIESAYPRNFENGLELSYLMDTGAFEWKQTRILIMKMRFETTW